MPELTPSLELGLLLVIIVLGLTFDFINGFHDTANAIATVVATRVLSPGRAVLMAGVLNFVGALSGTAVATTVGKGIIPPELSTQTLVASALVAAIMWNLLTWYYGLPSSSSHALIFSLVGAGVASTGWGAIQLNGLEKTFQGLVFSPVLGFLSAFVVMIILLNLFAKAYPATVTRFFGRAQLLSAAWMAFSHGSNDAQKTMGVITMALASYLHWGGSNWEVPLWVIMAAAISMGLGTAIGGWRIIRTIGLRVVQLRPIDGFAAETTAATIIEAASRLGVPVSTTHTISSAILGVGATRRLSAVRWGVAGQIVMGWVLTIPACFLLAWFLRTSLRLLGA
ncbi:MAG TPA: inorganic phosphate transporter [Chloroflexota bacterium]|jgi:PiT family inorganic phosphate transporter